MNKPTDAPDEGTPDLTEQEIRRRLNQLKGKGDMEIHAPELRAVYRMALRLSAQAQKLEKVERELQRERDSHSETIGARDYFEDAIQSAHIALGGDGEWVAKMPPQEPPDSGDLARDVLVLAEDAMRLREAAEQEAAQLRATVTDALWLVSSMLPSFKERATLTEVGLVLSWEQRARAALPSPAAQQEKTK